MKRENRLKDETSPYLLQHARNPVDWYPWSVEALQRAREEAKPILLSVGYSACHWCHVMERESFENEQIAEQMNRDFVCIKVDREERPDIDDIYMTAVQMMTGQGGWPMTVFLTPEGKPFYGGTYYPPDDRYGRPGFPRVLKSVAEAWRDRRGEVEEQAGSMSLALRDSNAVNFPSAPITADLFNHAYQKLAQSFDRRFGGFGGAPKFPQPMLLDFVMRYAHRSKRTEPLQVIELTLEKMAFGGMYDQVGGGFHRYSTDEYWLAPHFEKMLYDNAQLAVAYLHAFQITGDILYRRICEETLDYVRREMTDPAGGFYCAQDADSEGVEGKFFVWSTAEVKEVLGEEDGEFFCRFYDITEKGNFEGHNIANITVAPEAFAKSIGMALDEFNSKIGGMRELLFHHREKRIKPHRDEKILTSWNGLMLAAFAEAGATLDRADYVQTAVNNAEFVLRELYTRNSQRLMRTGKHIGAPLGDGGGVEQDHPLLHSSSFKVAPIYGFLEDYAFFIFGLLKLYEATFEREWVGISIELADLMIELFQDPDGGFFNTARDSEALIHRPKDLMDNATPSGASVVMELLLRLDVLTGEDRYQQIASTYLRKMAQAMEQHPSAFGRLLSAADFYVGPTKELAVVGKRDEPATQRLIAAARRGFHPNLVIAQADDAESGKGLPLLEGRDLVDGKPTAYLCENYACKQPVTEALDLEGQLSA